MYSSIAFMTALSLFVGYVPGSSERTADSPVAVATEVEILDRNNYTDEDGREINYVVWVEDGELFADISIYDPANRDWIEMWLEDETFRFEGVADGEPFSDSEPAASFYDMDPDLPTCFGWVALVCVGAGLVILAPGCQYLSFCVPDPGNSVPPGSPGGGGDGESGDDGGDGDGDE